MTSIVTIVVFKVVVMVMIEVMIIVLVVNMVGDVVGVGDVVWSSVIHQLNICSRCTIERSL